MPTHKDERTQNVRSGAEVLKLLAWLMELTVSANDRQAFEIMDKVRGLQVTLVGGGGGILPPTVLKAFNNHLKF